jgi:RNA polymerase sigma-70 factor (ECF subfamily)
MAKIDTTDEHNEPLARLKHGDEQGLAELFSEHRHRLWRLVHFRLDRRLYGRVDADDILQEAYLDAADRVGQYVDSPGSYASFFLWLRLIVSQTLIEVHRRHLGTQMRDADREVSIHARRYPQATSISLAVHLLGHLTSPSQAAARAEMSDNLQAAMEEMDPIDREVLALRHFEELTNGEAAEVLGIQHNAASMRYVRALARLKDILCQFPGFSNDDAVGPES